MSFDPESRLRWSVRLLIGGFVLFATITTIAYFNRGNQLDKLVHDQADATLAGCQRGNVQRLALLHFMQHVRDGNLERANGGGSEAQDSADEAQLVSGDIDHLIASQRRYAVHRGSVIVDCKKAYR